MNIRIRNYGEFVEVATRLTELGFKWNAGQDLIGLYDITDFNDVKIKLIECWGNGSRAGCPAIVFCTESDYNITTEDFLNKPFNFALANIEK